MTTCTRCDGSGWIHLPREPAPPLDLGAEIAYDIQITIDRVQCPCRSESARLGAVFIKSAMMRGDAQ